MWNDKLYHTLDYELKKIFSEKAIKLSIDGGFTCPNRDGKLGTRGCIFCSERGSGDFTQKQNSIRKQIEDQKQIISSKWKSSSYIAYFQNYTNTYDSAKNLRDIYNEALSCENIKGIAIATRADCLDDEVLDVLDELNQKTFLWVELGLQSIHESTGNFIRRGYDIKTFDDAVERLRSKNIMTVVHLILGLPNETKDMMLESVKYVSDSKFWGIKLHMLHVLKNTDLERYYNSTRFHILSQDEYVNIVCDALEILNESIVIHRLTGDGKKSEVIEPRWTLNKLLVLSSIDKKLRDRKSFQGKRSRL